MKIAVVRVRGEVHKSEKEKITLKCLNLANRNYCTVIDDNPCYRGMILSVNHLITWGRIDKDTFTLLLKKRGRLEGNKKISMSDKEMKSFVDEFFAGKKSMKDINVLVYFRLNSPKKGYGRKGIKKPFSLGGALGSRLEKINDLIRRMM
jgi:large subunit ribosomal protein L30